MCRKDCYKRTIAVADSFALMLADRHTGLYICPTGRLVEPQGRRVSLWEPCSLQCKGKDRLVEGEGYPERLFFGRTISSLLLAPLTQFKAFVV